jgi:hypothetical protein
MPTRCVTTGTPEHGDYAPSLIKRGSVELCGANQAPASSSPHGVERLVKRHGHSLCLTIVFHDAAPMPLRKTGTLNRWRVSNRNRRQYSYKRRRLRHSAERAADSKRIGAGADEGHNPCLPEQTAADPLRRHQITQPQAGDRENISPNSGTPDAKPLPAITVTSSGAAQVAGNAPRVTTAVASASSAL